MKGMFVVVLLLQVYYFAVSSSRNISIITAGRFADEPIKASKSIIVFFTRGALVILLFCFLALMRCHPITEDEQVRCAFSPILPCLFCLPRSHTTPQKLMHSVLFDHHLEREDSTSQCRVIQECFDAHAQRCEAQFSSHQMTFMRIMCISSALHGAGSTISSQRTRGLMQLLFLRLWPMTPREKEVALSVKKTMQCHGLHVRLSILARVAVHTSIMELVAWLGLIVYAHTILSNSAVTGVFTGFYDEMLQKSSNPWNVSRGQDPRFVGDMIHLMSDNLLACLAFCSIFPVPVSASLILLLPVTLWIQVCVQPARVSSVCRSLIVTSLRCLPFTPFCYRFRSPLCLLSFKAISKSLLPWTLRSFIF